jgi:DNA polymerase kappa
VQIPGIGKVTEQTLQALGVSTCSDLITHAALLTALLSDISSSSLIEAGLGLGAMEHSSRGGGPGSSEPARKGISCERTFGAMSNPAEMEQMVGVQLDGASNSTCGVALQCTPVMSA